MFGGRSRVFYSVALLCVTAGIATGGFFLATTRAHAIPPADSGECVMHASLSFATALPDPRTNPAPLLLEPFSFSTAPTQCTSAFGSIIYWQGGGAAAEASCYSLVDLASAGTQVNADNQLFNSATTGYGNMTSQHWDIQSEDSGFLFSAVGTFVPDPSVYGATGAATPLDQCLAGNLTTIYLEGAVTFEYRSTLVPLP